MDGGIVIPDCPDARKAAEAFAVRPVTRFAAQTVILLFYTGVTGAAAGTVSISSATVPSGVVIRLRGTSVVAGLAGKGQTRPR